MRFVRTALFALALAAAPAAMLPTDAEASVMIAVPFDALVKDADAVAVVLPLESKSVWEDGRITTYTRVKVDKGVAGETGASEVWIRTLGGVVGKIGQLVDGEPVLAPSKPSLLFLRRFKAGDNWEVSARAQGQYPVLVDEVTKAKKVIRSMNMGVLLAPKAKVAPGSNGPGLSPQSVSPVVTDGPISAEAKQPRLASDVLHDRPLDDVAREIAATWKRLHTTTSTTR
jgi:hypothetical protein